MFRFFFDIFASSLGNLTYMEKKKILFVAQEIFPFLPKSEIATTARKLPQGIQEAGKEIRVFTPRYGSINERRHQLHEVIRLSGMNLVIDDNDHPLIIKVASIAAARMQVYFIDNEEFFKRKNPTADDKGEFYKDNDERAMFFCRGVLETVKKLGWQPDVIHCHGWFTAPMALYVKKHYAKDPHFADTKVVYSLYNDKFNKNWDARFAEKLKFDGFDDQVVSQFKDTSHDSIIRSIVSYCDGVNVSSENLDPSLRSIFDEAKCLKQDYVPEEQQAKVMSDFFNRVIEQSVLI
jgi:starch synthase